MKSLNALCSASEPPQPQARYQQEVIHEDRIANADCRCSRRGVASTAPADTMEGHTIVPPQEIKWGPAPAVLPPGAEAAVLFGDPSKEGLFVLRLKLPAGYSVAPHMHPVDEVLTVISGTFRMGMGETADQSKAQPLPAGSFFALPPGTAHYVFIERRDGCTNQHRRSLGTHLHQPEGRPAAEVAVKSRSIATSGQADRLQQGERDRALGSAPSM